MPLVGLSDAYAKRALQGISPLPLTVGRYASGTLVVLGGFLLLEGSVPSPAVSAWPWALLAGLAAGAGILGLYVGIDRRGPTQAALVVAAAPVVTLILEALVLDSGPGPWGLAGIGAVLSGVACVAWCSGEEVDS